MYFLLLFNYWDLVLYCDVCVCLQFWLVMNYLSTMTQEQTLVIYSGHPLGLFPSHRDAPRLVITNGMVCPSVCLSVSLSLCLSVHSANDTRTDLGHLLRTSSRTLSKSS